MHLPGVAFGTLTLIGLVFTRIWPRDALLSIYGAPMATADKRKQSLYFPEAMLKDIQLEANRQDRSLSWIVQQAWRIAQKDIKRFPSINDISGGSDDERGRDE